MRIMKMFRFLFAFLLFQHFVVDDEGAGAGSPDVGDIDIDDIEDENEGNEQKPEDKKEPKSNEELRR